MENLNQSIAEKLNLDGLPLDEQEEILENIGSAVLQAVLERAVESMTDEEQDKFDEFFDNNQDDPEKILEYLEVNVSGFDEMLDEELEEIVDELA